MIVLNGNFAVGCAPGTDYLIIQLFQYMLERTDAITNEVLEPIRFVLALYNKICFFKLICCCYLLSEF